MKKGIVGKKIGMTQIFTEDGRLIPVTVIDQGPLRQGERRPLPQAARAAP